MSRGPKKDTKASSKKNDCYHCKQLGHMKKNRFKYKEMLKKKGGLDLIELVPMKNNQIKLA